MVQVFRTDSTNELALQEAEAVLLKHGIEIDVAQGVLVVSFRDGAECNVCDKSMGEHCYSSLPRTQEGERLVILEKRATGE